MEVRLTKYNRQTGNNGIYQCYMHGMVSKQKKCEYYPESKDKLVGYDGLIQ